MSRTLPHAAEILLLLANLVVINLAVAEEPLLRRLPPGLYLKNSTEISAAQTSGVAKKLGGDIKRLTQSVINVQGQAIQINVIRAADEASATAIYGSLLKIKSPPFCLRKKNMLVEYVGEHIDEALATKTSYELGLVAKPNRVRYRVVAELSTVDKSDYMACNPLFNLLLTLSERPPDATKKKIRDMAERFEFGRSLELRNPKLANIAAQYEFQPAATANNETVSNVSYSFDSTAMREGIPFVTVTMEITADESGLSKNIDAPVPALHEATPFWPADDPEIQRLAHEITAGKRSNGAKAMAILEWLAPGKNLKFLGQTGSRWGTAKVLEQKFGHCWDFADCFVTLCRAVNVPTRQVGGWLYGSSGHIWAEFYREGKGWQQVDATGGGKLRCGIYHIPYFTSEDGEMPILYVSMPKIELIESP